MPRDTAGLGSSPFARRYWGNRCYFLFLRVLRCFSSPRSPPGKPGVAGSLPPGCPIRKSASLGIFAPRRGFSQLVTSFFASESLGIPHAPLLRSVFPSRNTPGLPAGASCAFTFVHLLPLLREAALVCSTLSCLLSRFGLNSIYWRSALASMTSMCSFLVWRITESNR